MHSKRTDIVHCNFSTPCLPLTTLSSGEDLPSSLHPRIKIIHGTRAPVHALVVKVAIAMASGLHPKSLPNGLCGAYLFFNPISGKKIVVAKPVDEEPLALNNPKDLRSQLSGQSSLNTSICIGEADIRELAIISLITAPSLLYLQ
ncbi:hypothetical protein HN51_058179 [Arachis hypogaea]